MEGLGTCEPLLFNSTMMVEGLGTCKPLFNSAIKEGSSTMQTLLTVQRGRDWALCDEG